MKIIKSFIACFTLFVLLCGCNTYYGPEIKTGQTWERKNDNPFIKREDIKIIDVKGDYVEYGYYYENDGPHTRTLPKKMFADAYFLKGDTQKGVEEPYNQ